MSERQRPEKRIRVMGSRAYASNSFVDLMVRSLEGAGSIDYRGYSLRRSLSTWPDVWHINWPESTYRSESAFGCFLKSSKLLLQLGLVRILGTRIVWTVHNLTPHEIWHPRIEAWFWRGFRRRVDLYVHLSNGGGELFRDRFPAERSKQHVHLRHPAYPVPDSALMDRDAARAASGVEQDATVFLVTGLLREYKNIPSAVRAFRETRDPGCRLVIAGRASSDDLAREIVAAAGDDPRVSVRIAYMEERELSALIRAADLVVLPYGDFLNSGVLMLSLSLSRPVLAPITPVTRDIEADVGSRWVSTYSAGLTPDVLTQSAEWVRSRADGGDGPDLSGYEWELFAEGLTTAYNQVAASR